MITKLGEFYLSRILNNLNNEKKAMGVGHKDKSGKFHPHGSGRGVSEKDMGTSSGDTIKVPHKDIIPQPKIEIKKETILDKIKIFFKDDGYGPYFDDDESKGEARNKYKVTVEYNGKRTTFPFGDSIANTEGGKDPESDPEDYRNSILEILTSDYYYTKENYPNYQDFASEFGYGEDSRKGERIYARSLRQGEKLHSIFTDSDIEKIREALEL
jgi:hypothetical protein